MTLGPILRRAAAAAVLSLAATSGADAQAQQILASPRDSAMQMIGGAHVMVDYSRPSKRGRQIFGGLVPYDQVWRTGANAATTFVTSRDLVVGGTSIPAGTYSLYTLPSAKGWKLIINKQAGQWGTEYNESQDLARVDLKVETVRAPVEKFTIAIEPQGTTGGTLALSWDTTRASVPFTIKQ
ncbi:MAG TPA: DUF2911 domain-containing protein [Gemmatimonadaceae bacterium]|nr:DUF2911 domain-containing protein [Gemmatimonadaceae bacterium]